MGNKLQTFLANAATAGVLGFAADASAAASSFDAVQAPMTPITASEQTIFDLQKPASPAAIPDTRHTVITPEMAQSIPTFEEGFPLDKISPLRHYTDLMRPDYKDTHVSIGRTVSEYGPPYNHIDIRTEERFTSHLDSYNFDDKGYLVGAGTYKTWSTADTMRDALMPSYYMKGSSGGGGSPFEISYDQEAGLCTFEVRDMAVAHMEYLQSSIDGAEHNPGIEIQGISFQSDTRESFDVSKETLTAGFTDVTMGVFKIKPVTTEEAYMECDHGDVKGVTPKPVRATINETLHATLTP